MNTRRQVEVAIGLIAIVGIFWATWAINGISFAKFALGRDEMGIAEAGQWGDSFGAINALISSLGFCAVALTLWSQTKALDHQQKALEIQQNELKQQQEDQYRQRFETTFFEMLKLLRDCRDEFWYRDSKGLSAFKRAADELNLFETNRHSYPGDLFVDYKNSIHQTSETTLSPYFRVIYRMLDKIRKDLVLDISEKQSYSKLLRGQLSSSEILIIGVNGKMHFAKDMASMIEQFRLLKYLPEGYARDFLKEHYAPDTFLGHDPIGNL